MSITSILKECTIQYGPEFGDSPEQAISEALSHISQVAELVATGHHTDHCDSVSTFHVGCYVFGSAALAAIGPGSDVDVVVLGVGPEAKDCKIMLQAMAEVMQQKAHIFTDTLLIPDASVPVLGATLVSGLKVDVIYARCAGLCVVPAVPQLVSDDMVIAVRGDAQALRALNGIRTLGAMQSQLSAAHWRAMPGALRLLKAWAKSRCMYGGAQGWLSGIILALIAMRAAMDGAPATEQALVLAVLRELATRAWAEQPVYFCDPRAKPQLSSLAAAGLALAATMPTQMPIDCGALGKVMVSQADALAIQAAIDSCTLSGPLNMPGGMGVYVPVWPPHNTAYAAGWTSLHGIQAAAGHALAELSRAHFAHAQTWRRLLHRTVWFRAKDCVLLVHAISRADAGASVHQRWAGFLASKLRRVVHQLEQARYVPHGMELYARLVPVPVEFDAQASPDSSRLPGSPCQHLSAVTLACAPKVLCSGAAAAGVKRARPNACEWRSTSHAIVLRVGLLTPGASPEPLSLDIKRTLTYTTRQLLQSDGAIQAASEARQAVADSERARTARIRAQEEMSKLATAELLPALLAVCALCVRDVAGHRWRTLIEAHVHRAVSSSSAATATLTVASPALPHVEDVHMRGVEAWTAFACRVMQAALAFNGAIELADAQTEEHVPAAEHAVPSKLQLEAVPVVAPARRALFACAVHHCTEQWLNASRVVNASVHGAAQSGTAELAPVQLAVETVQGSELLSDPAWALLASLPEWLAADK